VQHDEADVGAVGLRRYAANVTWMLVAEVAGKLASFVFLVIVARSLGARDFGYFNFVLSFVPLFLVFGRWGLESTVIREIARDRGRLSELFATGLTLRASLGLLGLTLALVTGPLFLDSGEAYLAMVIVGIALFLDEASGFLGTVFKAFEQMQFHALVVLTNRLLSTALAILAVSLGAGLLVVCATYLAGSAGAFAFGWLALRTRFPPIDFGRVSRTLMRGLLRTGFVLGLAGVLNTAVFRIDSVLLQAIKGPVEVGLYASAYRFFESMLFVSWSLGGVALPRLAREHGAREFTRTFELTTVLSLAFYLPLALVTALGSTWIVTTIYSDRFAEAHFALAVLGAAAVLYALAYAARIAAIALGRMREIAIVAGIALAVNLGINAVAIPRYGFEGAAWAMLVTEAVEATLLMAVLLRTTQLRLRARPLLVPALATAGLAVALLGLGIDGGAALLVAGLAYPPTLLLAARVLAPEELRRVPDAFRRPSEAPVG